MKYDIMLVFLCLVGVCACQSQGAGIEDDTGIEAGTWMEADLNTVVYNQQCLKELTSVNPEGNDFQGGRGSGHLVCYTSSFGDRTKTNEWGNEAVIENGQVISVGGNNSKIPKNGLVISGNGTASRWISNNLRVGMQVELKGTVIYVITTENTFIYQAREIFRKVLERQEERGILTGREIEAFEQEIQKKFNSLIKAKKEKNVETAFQLSRQILSNAQNLYYSTFESRENEFRGAWIRLADKTPEELKATIQSMDEAGINAVLPETIYNGYAIYPDAHPLLPQLPQFNGWDPMQIMVEECKKYGMKVIPWCEMFFVGKEGSPLVKEKPEWLGKFRHGEVAAVLEPGFHYFCPSRPEVSDFLLATLDTLLSRYDLEGVQLDYIRYSLSDPWDKGFCYCDYCRQQVKNRLHFDIMSISPENKNEWNKWNQYRVNNITNFVKQVNVL
ncbi:MAG: family 10 glycosylhydrolase, partial [Bacteroidales bacterium]|nr:family 10 glycosylhydrolase [Bacteroidales bacterium]